MMTDREMLQELRYELATVEQEIKRLEADVKYHSDRSHTNHLEIIRLGHIQRQIEGQQ